MKNISELKPIFDSNFITFDEQLCKSIKRFGILSPIIVSDNVICDGHKRYKACMQLGIESVPVTEIFGSPVELFIELNNRDFDVNTVAMLARNLDDKKVAEVCRKVGFSDSPQMVSAIRILSEILETKPYLVNNKLPSNIWRELGHLGNSMKKYAEALLTMEGTVSEKRNIASCLRQAQRRNELPDSIKAEKASDILPLLQKTAQPRRTYAFDKYEKAVAQINFPSGVVLKIDPTFAQSGIVVTLPIQANDLEKLDKTKEALKVLFKAVPEL